MVKEVIKTPNFESCLHKLDKSYIERIKNIIKRIIENPKIGKPMRYVRKGTRELYIKPFRLSYFYDGNLDSITLFDLYHKKKQ